MEENNRPKWLVPMGIGCALILCLCLIGAGAVYFLGDQIMGQLGDLGDIGNFIDLGDIPTLPEEFEDILTPPPDDMPIEPDPLDENPLPPVQQDDPSLGSAQISDQTAFFDDFSTDAFDWAVVDDGMIVLDYEDQAYSFEVKEPNYLDGVYLPTLFDPSNVKFDVWGPPGEQGGTVGVECRIQLDGENLTSYYYVEFDLYYQDVFVGGYLDDEYVEFHESENEFGTLPLQNMTSDPSQANTIEVSCNPDNVVVSVNGMLEYDIAIPGEYRIGASGPMTFFIYTYENTMAGYKVFFDNVEAYP